MKVQVSQGLLVAKNSTGKSYGRSMPVWGKVRDDALFLDETDLWVLMEGMVEVQ